MSRIAASILPALLFFSPGGAPAQDAAAEKVWRFRALLDGHEIGEHSFTLRSSGRQMTLRSVASFRVKLFFLTAYTYDHRADEGWANGCLNSLQSETKENSATTAVTLERSESGFVVRGPKGEAAVGECPLTFAYWNPDVLQRSRLLNPQTGDWLPVKIAALGKETISVRGTSVEAARFRITAPDTSIDIWYAQRDGSGEKEWVSLESITPDGYTVKYDLL